VQQRTVLSCKHGNIRRALSQDEVKPMRFGRKGRLSLTPTAEASCYAERLPLHDIAGPAHGPCTIRH